MNMSSEKVNIRDIILKSKYIVALTGAGISAESGIPIFREKNGLWTKYKPEEIASYEAFKRHPDIVWQWYIMRMKKIKKAKPNKAHHILSKWETRGILKSIITQNVDGLHQGAGSKNVIELHGNIWRVKCPECNSRKFLDKIPRYIPRCKDCGSILRPDVVWFGEQLDPEILATAYNEAKKADIMIIIGTSGIVYPATYIPIISKNEGAKLIEINPNDTALSNYADIIIREKASISLSKLDKLIGI